MVVVMLPALLALWLALLTGKGCQCCPSSIGLAWQVKDALQKGLAHFDSDGVFDLEENVGVWVDGQRGRLAPLAEVIVWAIPE